MYVGTASSHECRLVECCCDDCSTGQSATCPSTPQFMRFEMRTRAGVGDFRGQGHARGCSHAVFPWKVPVLRRKMPGSWQPLMPCHHPATVMKEWILVILLLAVWCTLASYRIPQTSRSEPFFVYGSHCLFLSITRFFSLFHYGEDAFVL